MLDLGRLNPLNLLIYGGTKLVYNQVTKQPKKNTNSINNAELIKALFKNNK